MTVERLGYVRVQHVLRTPGENFVTQRGFGFEVVKGAQYLRTILPVHAQAPDVVEAPEYGELFDGCRVSVPGGFVSLNLIPVDDIPASNVARVVLKVWTLPALVPVATSGIEAMGAVALLNCDLNPNPGDSQHLMVPATSQLLIHDDCANGYQENVAAPAGQRRSRTVGDENRPWWPTPLIYLGGFICTDAATHAAALDIFINAYLIDANGARNVVPLYTVTTGNTIAQAWETLYQTGGLTLDRVYHIANNNNPNQGLPYPVNGLRIWVRNQSASDMPIAGSLWCRTA